jgi:ABC-2 type transport system ATP-binding protein
MIVLRTEHLTKRFKKIVAVSDLNLQIEEGEVFGFLGPNGSGKSTTIGMVLGLIAPTHGRIELFGRDIKDDLSTVWPRVGVAMENPPFYPYLSGWDNLKIFSQILRDNAGSRMEEVLDTVKLSSRARDKFGTYSQGMKQRLALAYALLSNPRFLILDEPTNGLDPVGMREMRDLILRLKEEGKTIFLSSHLLSEVEQVCDHIGIIKEGRLVTQGRVDDLASEMGLEKLFLRAIEEG